MSDIKSLNKLLPYIEKAIDSTDQPLWLVYRKAKAMLCLGKNDEARKGALYCIKQKRTEYWAWDFLGKTYRATDKNKEFACYCKALTLQKDENFIAGVRLKVANELIKKESFKAAKHEIDKIYKTKTELGNKISTEIINIMNSEWYNKTELINSSSDMYKDYIGIAEALLFEGLPLIKSCIGRCYKQKEGKAIFSIYALFDDRKRPVEYSISKIKYAAN